MNGFNDLVVGIGKSPYTAFIALILTAIPVIIWASARLSRLGHYVVSVGKIGFKAQARRRRYRLAAFAVRNADKDRWQVFQAVHAAWLTMRISVLMLYVLWVFITFNMLLPSTGIYHFHYTALAGLLDLLVGFTLAIALFEMKTYQHVKRARLRFIAKQARKAR
jgi:hypothetical protein